MTIAFDIETGKRFFLEGIPSGGGDTSNLANKDLSNLSTIGKTNASGFGMPSVNYVALTLNDLASGSEHVQNYTATVNGWLRLSFYSSAVTSANDYGIMTLRNSQDTETINSVSYYASKIGSGINVTMPIAKNQLAQIKYNISGLTVSNYRFYFIYAQGEI